MTYGSIQQNLSCLPIRLRKAASAQRRSVPTFTTLSLGILSVIASDQDILVGQLLGTYFYFCIKGA